MLFAKDVKNLRIYKRQMFLPTLEDSDTPNKKTKSTIFLLTPNRKSSIALMNHPLMVNMKRYQSYYIERDLTYFISSKVLNSEEEMEEDYHYITDNQYPLNEDMTLQNFVVGYSGYLSDVEKLKAAFTIEDYHNILHAVKYYGYDMTLHLEVGEFPGIDEYFNFVVNEYKENGIPKKMLKIHVPRATIDMDEEYYRSWILNFVCKAIYIIAHPESVCTQAPKIFADTYTNADTSHNGADMSKATVDVYESTPITIENLGRKFKYATTTKFKVQKSRKLNQAKRQMDINFSPELNIPTPGTTSAPSSSDTASESALDKLEEGVDYFRLGNNRILMLAEDTKYDVQLRRLLWKDRIKKRQDIIEMDKQIKADVPWIKFAFPEISKYLQKNLFVDLYYYNEVFFKNNTWVQRRGFDLYFDLLERLINDSRLQAAGYTKKTIFIPVNDWDRNPNTKMWMYREDINPISIIYELMQKDPARLKKLFGNADIFFFDKDKYFKINFATLGSDKDYKKFAVKFKTFITKIEKGDTFDAEDLDDETAGDTKEAIKADIYDKIENAKGVDLTPRDSKAKKVEKEIVDTGNKSKPTYNASNKHAVPEKQKDIKKQKEEELVNLDGNKAELTKSADLEKRAQREEDLQRMADIIDDITSNAVDTSDALDLMDNNEELKQILMSLDTATPSGNLVNSTRRNRLNNLEDNLKNKTVQGVTVRELLEKEQDKIPIPTTSLKVSSPNEQWQEMTYMNFDKTYDLNADVVACFNHFSHVSLPFGITDLKVEDTSTSEDRKLTYTASIEDYRGKRQTLKLDIPTSIDNRLLLRGNTKVLSTQFVNMPIIKTDLDTCQIVTNYQKIFIRRHKESVGRSNVVASRVIKALLKYNGEGLKITYGDNSRICNKYQLPIDYIDIATEISMIEIPSTKTKIYFDQDVFNKDYPGLDYSKGVPFAVDSKGVVTYYNDMKNNLFSTELLNYLMDDNTFRDLFIEARPTNSGTYTRCNMVNSKIPLVVVVAHADGLEKVLELAGIQYELKEKLDKIDREDTHTDWIKFSDGYLVYRVTYTSSLLLNGLKDCPTEEYSMSVINDKETYMEFLDNFGGRQLSNGLDNFVDCLVDPITLEILNYYNMPTTFTEILLEANALLADNEYIKHTNTVSRRIRRAEQIAAYTYEALTEAYIIWANQVRHGRNQVGIVLKQSAVIDKILASPISSEDSVNNALGALEQTNTISFKGKSGLNEDRSYSLDKRTFDDSMLNNIGSSTIYSGSAGVTRMSTVNMNVEGVRGFVKQIDSDITKMNSVNTLTASENMIPFEVTHDDNPRVLMSFTQTAKHQTRVENADPLLITSGMDEALPYLTTNKFSYKASKNGKITNITENYIAIEYTDGTKEYINLQETFEHNSDGGYYVPMKLDVAEGIRIGSSVKAGDILAYDKLSFGNSVGETDNIAYKVGTLCKVAIMNTDDGFEDSGVCTHSLAERMTTEVVYKFEKVIEKDSLIFKTAKKGEYVNVDDPLIVWQDPYEDYDINSIFRTMGNDTDISTLGRRTLVSTTTGTIVDIKIFRTCELQDMSESVRKFVEQYEAPIKKLKKELESQGLDTKMLPATYALPPTGKLKKAQDAIYIEYYVQHKDILAVGDKGTFFAANKFIVKRVIPEGKEPYTDFRPNEKIDALLSIPSINKRMVTSIILNGSLNKLMIELDRSVKDMLGIPYDDSKA